MVQVRVQCGIQLQLLAALSPLPKVTESQGYFLEHTPPPNMKERVTTHLPTSYLTVNLFSEIRSKVLILSMLCQVSFPL